MAKTEKYFRDVVLNYDGVECLIWPFSRKPNGYAEMFTKSHPSRYVHRRVCEAVNGPPPTPAHQAAHNCGRGEAGCVAKRHVEWKTQSENEADKIVHGTHARGERHGNAKITLPDVLFIRQSSEPQHVLAKRFDVTVSYISELQRELKWSWIAKGDPHA